MASLQLDILQLVRVARVFRMLAVLRLYRIVQSYRGFDYEVLSSNDLATLSQWIRNNYVPIVCVI